MTKAIISNRIYFKSPSSEYSKKIIKELTYKIEGKVKNRAGLKNVEIIKNYKVLPGGVLSIPRGREDLIPEGYIIEHKEVTNVVPFPEIKFPLREAQVPVYESTNESCIINALVGWGKTATALHIAKKLEQKTLVVTHTTALRDQWVQEVKHFYGEFPGIIGSGKFDIEDHFIVIGNVQSVVLHIDRIAKEFGTVILDECHHVPATTFSSIIDSLYAKYRIGLSGTLSRTDGKHILFKDYFGPIVHKPPQSDTLFPTIKLVNSGIWLPPGKTWVEKVNTLLYDEEYQKFIANIARAHIDIGHSVLVVADRVEFLNNVKELIGEDCILITGETSFEERTKYLRQIERKEKMCIAGSRQIFSEGISVNILSCVILAVPTNNPIILEQIIGRVMRKHPNKLDPVVIDIQMASPAERKKNTDRLLFYAEKGFETISVK